MPFSFVITAVEAVVSSTCQPFTVIGLLSLPFGTVTQSLSNILDNPFTFVRIVLHLFKDRHAPTEHGHKGCLVPPRSQFRAPLFRTFHQQRGRPPCTIDIMPSPSLTTTESQCECHQRQGIDPRCPVKLSIAS